ncbi:protein jag [Streptococcus chenjunshii]|uniref:RNA-binding protein KhpB n=1 Tax=Streptococcus chenjunshii TaxID=2173853 RepID=A0A372KIU3_9STRE|nr:RNA-binding cell elongation regulator Jag/EloR [Streptococcus chenjunshii]AXQ77869.1 protein jag [Streptococcus chenjunshii]RFU49956.1 protein jag [Streptococcus chenjunshii]RFU52212.1 protein jag [Streptococcus chenjunshii]
MVIFTGSTVEEAIEKGLEELQISRLKAHIKVIAREKKGFLGFGKRPAQVDVEGITEATAHKADQKAVKGVPEAVNRQNAPVSSKREDALELAKASHILKEKEKGGQPENSALKEAVFDTRKTPQTILKEVQTAESAASNTEKSSGKNGQAGNGLPETVQKDSDFAAFVAAEFQIDAQNDDIEQATAGVRDYVKKVIYEMDIDATIEPSHTSRQINLQIETPEAGRVIGYHGKVLKSLQLLAQNFLYDRYSKNFIVSLNVHDYVEHRTETLIDFTQKVARRVLDSGRSYTMDPMSNSERKIVHKTITKIEGVESYSEGNDPNRYVVVAYKR